MLEIARDSTKMINTEVNNSITKDEIVLNESQKIENSENIHVDIQNNSTTTVTGKKLEKSLM